MLEEHWSLNACHSFALKNRLFSEQGIVCVKTLYNYVDTALLKVRNIDLPLKVRLRLKRLNNRQNLKKFGSRIIESNGLKRSMSKKSCSPDNAACEAFFGRLKNEMFNNRNWQGVSVMV